MLKTNVITKTYRVTMTNRRGDADTCCVAAESEACARDRVMVPRGWEITEVKPL